MHKVIASFCVVVFVFIGWKTFNWVWLRPKKLEKILRKQGFNGNSYRLLYGDLKDLAAAKLKAKTSSIGLSDDFLYRAAPTVYTATHRHGTCPLISSLTCCNNFIILT